MIVAGCMERIRVGATARIGSVHFAAGKAGDVHIAQGIGRNAGALVIGACAGLTTPSNVGLTLASEP